MRFLDLRPVVLAIALLVLPSQVVEAWGQQPELPAPEAWAALDRGDAEKAAALFREELERSPGNAFLHYGAGYAAFALGRTDAAISSLKRAIECNPRFVQAMVLLSQVAYQAADLDLAVRTLEKAAAIAPRDRRIAQQLEQWRSEAALHDSFKERSTVRFRVLFEGAAEKGIGDHVATVLESAYWRIGKRLNTYPSETLAVILYTNRQFQDITRAPAWAGGGYDGRIPLADLADGFDQFDSGTALVAYAESLVAGQLLCERLGSNLGPFLQMLGNGHTVDQALSSHNVQPDAFYAEWQRRINAK